MEKEDRIFEAIENLSNVFTKRLDKMSDEIADLKGDMIRTEDNIKFTSDLRGIATPAQFKSGFEDVRHLKSERQKILGGLVIVQMLVGGVAWWVGKRFF